MASVKDISSVVKDLAENEISTAKTSEKHIYSDNEAINDKVQLQESFAGTLIEQEPMNITQIPLQEPLISAANIKLEPIDYEENEEILADEFVTADILNVEKKLERQLYKERTRLEKKSLKQLNSSSVTEEELRTARYNRLMHLFEKSTFYSNFMKETLNGLRTAKISTKRKCKKRKCAGSDEEAKSSASNPKTRSKLKHTDSYNVAEIVNNKDLGDKDTNNKPSSPKSEEDKGNASQDESDATYVNAAGLTVPKLQPLLFEGGVMRGYQIDGLEWLKILDGNSVSGILADEMGLGKTIQVIGLICHLIGQGIPGPYVIIAPLSAIPNWMSEFKRFAPKIPVLLFHGNEPARARLVQQFSTWHEVAGKKVHPVIVTSFQIPLVEKRFFRSKTWRYLVVDEGHQIKNHRTQLAMELKRFNSVNRLILTGTPLQNNLTELWSLLNFLLPEIFDDLSSFETWFDCNDLLVKGGEDRILAQESEKQILSTMHQILSPFLLRRLKSEVELNLPPKKELLVFCPLTPTQKHLYSSVLDRSIDMMVSKQKEQVGTESCRRPKRRCVAKRTGKSYADAIVIDSDDDYESWQEVDYSHLTVTDVADPTYKLRMNMQNPSMLLRHVVNHPYLVQMPVRPGKKRGQAVARIDEELVCKSGKMLVLDALLVKLKERGHKVLIFSCFTMMLDLLADFLELRGYEFCALDGRMRLEARQEQIRLFNTDPDTFVFLVSTRAGGLGINLTAADTVIIFDSDWNPQRDLQAQDRCHRIGQTRPVLVYRLATEGTIDQVIIERAASKRKLEKMIIRKGAYGVDTKMNQPQTVDLADLRTLLRSDDFERVMHPNGFVFNEEELDSLLDRSAMFKKKPKAAKNKGAVKSTKENEE